MRILAIDPGPAESAWIVFENGTPVLWEKLPNRKLIHAIRDEQYRDCDHLAIEMVQSFGMSVGAEVFETVFWAGQFVEAWHPQEHTLVYRKDVKMHLCHSMRANDSNIRQALIDKFGGSTAIGKKKTPGPLYGISGDVWSALAVAVTFDETQRKAASA